MISSIVALLASVVAFVSPAQAEPEWFENSPPSPAMEVEGWITPGLREWLCAGSVYVLPSQVSEFEELVRTGDYIGQDRSTLGPEDSDLVSRALFAHMVMEGEVDPC